ncbi:DUF423 domain-containing protein [Algicola sagamiensis]|uniref:DUF423 domain-containing protein n=1 Tax=Algicola sagamiensis TaxID=163869 RepID=UPI00037B25D6|nr:DUF423 domain-containing protein [Algicola sagamiensis]
MKWIAIFTALSGAFSVILGAYAAHGLKKVLSDTMLQTFQTGVLYQFLHTIALLFVVLFWMHEKENTLFLSAYAFIFGIIAFSGSLYALALTGIKWFGPVTPLGGLGFILGWCLLAYALFKALP